MNDMIGEQLSALVDGEVGDAERGLLIRRILKDPSLQQRWERYHLISDALRSNLPVGVNCELAQRIQNAIRDEPTPTVSHGWANSRLQFVKPLGGAAIAASVAMLAIFGVQNLHSTHTPGATVPTLANQSTTNQPLEAQRVAGAPQPLGLLYSRVSGTRWDYGQPEVESHLNGYLVNHSEYTSGTNLHGMLPYARIAGYDVTLESE